MLFCRPPRRAVRRALLRHSLAIEIESRRLQGGRIHCRRRRVRLHRLRIGLVHPYRRIGRRGARRHFLQRHQRCLGNLGTFVLRRGTLRALPETSAFGFPTDWKALVTTTAFSWRGKARMAAEPLVRRGTDMDESIASFIGRRFGREAVTYLASPLLAGLHKGDATKLSMHALFPGFVDAERTHGSVVRSWRHRTARASSGPGSMSLDGGLGQLVQRLRRPAWFA